MATAKPKSSQSYAIKTKPIDTAKLAAKPTKSLPSGMTVGKPQAVSAAMKGMKPGKKVL